MCEGENAGAGIYCAVVDDYNDCVSQLSKLASDMMKLKIIIKLTAAELGATHPGKAFNGKLPGGGEEAAAAVEGARTANAICLEATPR